MKVKITFTETIEYTKTIEVETLDEADAYIENLACEHEIGTPGTPPQDLGFKWTESNSKFSDELV